MKMTRKLKFGLFALVAILLLIGFAGLFFHHHDADAHQHDCAVCRFAQHLFTTLVFIAGFIISLPSLRFWGNALKNFTSVVLGSGLSARAPPVSA